MQSNFLKTKIDFINNLRVLMTVLVILHHTLLAYGGPGGWYFTDATHNKRSTLLLLPWQVDPVIKLLIAAPFVIVFSFALGWLITRLPLAKSIL